MFIDLNETEIGQALSYDLCVIGAGAAGITLAREFESQNASVALLESGGFDLHQPIQNLNGGKITGVQYYPLTSTRLRFFGGTTNHWGGQSIPLDEFDFTERSWVADSGWPIEYQELSQHLHAAEEICGVPSGSYRWEHWRNLGVKSKFPLDRQVFEDAVFRFSRPNRRFGVDFRAEIDQSKNITCILNATALQLITDSTGQTVTEVEVGSLDGGRRTIRARQFVVACGGIENCRLLLLSNQTQKAGLGNANDQVGRYFMEHPNFDSGAIRFVDAKRADLLANPSQRVARLPLRLDFKLRPKIQQRDQLLNHSAFVMPVGTTDSHGLKEEDSFFTRAWRKVFGPSDDESEGEGDANILEQEYRLRARLEHAPHAESRVLLDSEQDAFGQPRAQLHLKFGDLEGRTIEHLQKALALELGKTGIGRMQVSFRPQSTDWQTKVGWQFHHCGGTRMHDSTNKGVVDSDCRVHGTDNLYIAGSSVFPTCGHANPTLNLVALTLRLAEKLKSELAA
jgi:choline dehydrogenase-like flavoprotein